MDGLLSAFKNNQEIRTKINNVSKGNMPKKVDIYIPFVSLRETKILPTNLCIATVGQIAALS